MSEAIEVSVKLTLWHYVMNRARRAVDRAGPILRLVPIEPSVGAKRVLHENRFLPSEPREERTC
jgi:hypothetical protein